MQRESLSVFSKNPTNPERVEMIMSDTPRPAKEIAFSISTNVSSFVNKEENKVIHQNVELKCFYEGNSTLIVGDKKIEVNAGDVLVINPYEFHSTVDCGKKIGKYHLFMIPLDYFSDIGENKLDLKNLFFVQKKLFANLYPGDSELFDLLQRAADEYNKKDIAHNFVIKGLLMNFFAVLLRRNINTKEEYNISATSLYSYNLIEPALRHIRDNFSEKVTIEALAALCGLSKYYFCHNFKKATGKSAMEYLRDYRITTADVILTNTDESIDKVAKICGFESANYFYRCYKNRYGLPPSKRRNDLKVK